MATGPVNMAKNGLSENLLLAALPALEYQRILPQFVEVELKLGNVVFRENEAIEGVYFLTSGIISLLTAIDERSLIEVGLVGREGVVGISVFLGVSTANHRAVVQGAGRAMRIAVNDLLRETQYCSGLSRVLRRFAQTSIFQASQAAACYRFHQTEARLARWLLMTSDRIELPDFQITQEFLSNMLGVRREAVNKSVRGLQGQDLITHSRGKISIVDRPGLESAACCCYAAILAEENSFPVFEAI